MVAEILNQTLESSFESDWVEYNRFDFVENKYKNANSIQISWEDVSGTSLDGLLQIYVSNDIDSECFGKEIAINSSSNISNVLMIVLMAQFKFFKFKFIKNSISNGKIYVSVLYV